MRRVLSVSANRADMGILTPVWAALAARPEVELHLLLTGAHQADPGLATGSIPPDAVAHRHGADLGGTEATAALAMAEIGAGAAEVYGDVMPDIVLVIGDRLDMLPAAVAALPFNIPLAHVHGGELTLGAIDDRARHAMTKLAHVHFTATIEAAERVHAMGEETWRIHVTGAPGLDTLLAAEAMEATDFAREIGFETIETLRLVTVHPETNAPDPAAPLAAVLAALDAVPASTLFTAPNTDPGGAAMRREIETFVAARPWARFRDTLGAHLYANAMRHAAVMVGNSSSALIEAPVMDLPAINVGGRQEGRARGCNVINCPAEAGAVRQALRNVDKTPRQRTIPAASPYGDGHAAPRIAAHLADLPAREQLLRKRFSTEPFDFIEPWAVAPSRVAELGR